MLSVNIYQYTEVIQCDTSTFSLHQYLSLTNSNHISQFDLIVLCTQMIGALKRILYMISKPCDLVVMENIHFNTFF